MRPRWGEEMGTSRMILQRPSPVYWRSCISVFYLHFSFLPMGHRSSDDEWVYTAHLSESVIGDTGWRHQHSERKMFLMATKGSDARAGLSYIATHTDAQGSALRSRLIPKCLALYKLNDFNRLQRSLPQVPDAKACLLSNL